MCHAASRKVKKNICDLRKIMSYQPNLGFLVKIPARQHGIYSSNKQRTTATTKNVRRKLKLIIVITMIIKIFLLQIR